MALTLVQLISDSFTRANAATLGANWSAPAGSSMQISSNQAIATATSVINFSTWSASPFQGWNPDQFSSVNVVSRSGNVNYFGAAVRLPGSIGVPSAGVTGALGMYFFGGHAGNNTVSLQKANPSLADLQTYGAMPAFPATFGLAVQTTSVGVVLTPFLNGVAQTPFTDTSASQILWGSPGIMEDVTVTTADVPMTNFSAGAVLNAPSSITNFGSLTYGSNSSIGSITAVGIPIQFSLPQGQLASSERYLGRLQMIVDMGVYSQNNQVINPIWSLIATQSNSNSWFSIPAETLPINASLNGQTPSLYSQWYDVSGLGGCTFQFSLLSGTISGSLPVYALVG